MQFICKMEFGIVDPFKIKADSRKSYSQVECDDEERQPLLSQREQHYGTASTTVKKANKNTADKAGKSGKLGGCNK